MNKQLSLSIRMNDSATLNDFCWKNNDLLKDTIENTLHKKNPDSRFLTFWGNQGSGKSHLLQACCHAMQQDNTAIYLPLKMLYEWGPASLEGVEDQALVTLDDIHFIAGNLAWEEAIFHLYNKIRDQGKTILIISSEVALNALRMRLPDLRSRLSWGLVLPLHELDDESKIETLKDRALKKGFHLPETVAHFLVSRCTRNMHDLNEALNQLDEASLSAQRKITIPFVKAVLGL